MALFHIKTQILKRSKGQNVIEAIAYRRAARLKDERTGQIFDYTRKSGVIHSEIVIPNNAPTWIQDISELQKTNPNKAAERLWNSVENHEKRKDAQLAREFNIALPIEFNQEQCIALTREYVQLFCDEGMVVDFSIHWDKGNPHAHITVAMRGLTIEGWGHKERAWNGKDFHEKTMVHLAEVTNKHLALAGLDTRISHLSYAAQGIDLEPTIHEGNRNNLANQQARARNKEIRLRNLQKIIENPAILLDKLSKERASFSLEDVAKTLNTQLEAANQAMLPTPTPPKPGGVVSRNSNFVASNVAPRFLLAPQQTLNGTVASLHAVDTMPHFQFETETPLPEIIHTVLQAITQKESVFNERHLTQVLSQHLHNPETVADVLLQLKASPELLAIGPGEDGRERYTTREMFDLENDLQELAEQLTKKTTHKVNARTIRHCIEEHDLKDDQAKGLRHLLKGGDLSLLVGRAGTGKSYSLKAAKAAWEMSGYRVHGIAIAGIAADNLAEDSGIESRTIESFCYALKKQKLLLNANDVVVMDEAGMTDSLSMFKVLLAVRQVGAKLVLVGDHAQLQPVGPGAIFRALLERIGFTELTTIRRQKEVWQREATAHFAAGRTQKALEYYETHDCIVLSGDGTSAKKDLIKDWDESVKKSSLADNLIIAYQNVDVNELNRLARQTLVSRGALKNSYVTHNHEGNLKIAMGERLLFLENSWRYGVKNGQRATVVDLEVDANNHVTFIKVLLDGNKNKMVEFSPEKYKKFAHGYAVTVHRSQGATVNNAFVLALKFWNRHLSYVAMTRHRHSAKLYSDKEIYPSLSAFKKGMARIGIKDSVLDYPLAFAARRGIDVETLSSRFQKHVIEKLKWMGQSLKNNFEQTFFPGQYWAKKAIDAEKQQLLQETLTRREDAKLVAAYVDASREVGVAYEALAALQKELGVEQDISFHELALLLKDEPALTVFKEASHKRNEIAAQIYLESGRYTEALNIYDICLEKLKKESEAYQIRHRVAQYLIEIKQGRVVYQNRLASLIQRDIKTHYPFLLDLGVCLKTLKTHATAHDRRIILKKCSSSEQEAFKGVENYIKCSEHCGRLWNEIITKEKNQKISALVSVDDLSLYEISRLQALAKAGTPISRELMMEAREAIEQRNKVAAEIYQELARYKIALDFYEFGSLRFSSNETSESDLKSVQWAKERLERLEKQALTYIQKETHIKTIKDYIAFTNNQNEQRYSLASHILANKKSYYSIIFELYPDAFSLLKTLHQDNKTHQRNELLKTLSPEEQDAFLKVESYVLERRKVGQVWGEMKEATNPNHPLLKTIMEPHQILKDAFAYSVYETQDKHLEALQHFKVDVDKLKRDSERHAIRQRVAHYLTAGEEGNTTERNKLALEIVQSIKIHYFALLESQVSIAELRVHAKAEERQLILNNLSPLEQEDFKTVERYVQCSLEAGKLWREIHTAEAALTPTELEIEEEMSPYEIARLTAITQSGTPLSRETFIKAQAISQERASLAQLIYQDLERYQVGLSFYQIGHYSAENSPVADFTNEFKAKAEQWAKERLVRLEKQAVLFKEKELKKETIHHYIHLLKAKDNRRWELAVQILQNKRQYFNAIFELTKEPLSLIQALYQDVKAYKRETFIQNLSEEELQAFSMVEQYYQASKVVNQVWHETKAIPEPRPSILKEISHPPLVLRDALADSIYNQPEFYKRALDFFKIKPEHLGKKAFYHQVRNDLNEFKKRTGDLKTRMALARKIVSNRSAYVVVKEDGTVNWHKLQNYADYALKMERLASLSPAEQENYYSVLKYKRLRREAGKCWGEIFKYKQEGKDIPETLFERGLAINAERNQLASHIKAQREHFDEFLFSARVQTKDIGKHALAHEKFAQKQHEIKRLCQKQTSESSPTLPLTPSKPKTTSHKEKAKPYWDIRVVNETLAFRAEQFVQHILGSPLPRTSNATTYCYGSKKGSLHVTVGGDKAGLWYDFATTEGGNLLDLIQRERNLDFKEALQYAAEWAGIAPETGLIHSKPKKRAYDEFDLSGFIENQKFSMRQLNKINEAKNIVAHSTPITGTLAERYLKEHRGITDEVLEETFRFNPSVFEPETKRNCPALIVIARNEKHEVQSVQCIYLDKVTARKLPVKVQKRDCGPKKGTCVRVQRGQGGSNQFAIAEGPETALSIAQSNKNLSVWASLGISNLKSAPIPTGSNDILICADNDGIGAASNKSLTDAIHALSERGLNVYVAKPTDCKDFNDVLLKHGSQEVNRLIDNKQLVKEAMTLEQLITNKNALVSNEAKIIAQFEIRFREHEKIIEPQTIQEVEEKIILLEQAGKHAVLIKDNTLLKEIAKRHNIDRKIFNTIRAYVEHQKWSIEATSLAQKLNITDPIKDYLEAIAQKEKLPLPWQTHSKTEKEQWNTLNNKIQQLAFIIDKTPPYQFIAKEQHIYENIRRHSFELQAKINEKISLEQGIGIGI